jgi:hypothetical protein
MATRAQAAAHHIGRTGRMDSGFFDCSERWLDPLVETTAFLARTNRACGSVQQPHADPCFEAGYRTADTGGCYPERVHCSHEATAFHDGGQHDDARQQSSIKRHILIPDHVSSMM